MIHYSAVHCINLGVACWVFSEAILLGIATFPADKEIKILDGHRERGVKIDPFQIIWSVDPHLPQQLKEDVLLGHQVPHNPLIITQCSTNVCALLC